MFRGQAKTEAISRQQEANFEELQHLGVLLRYTGDLEAQNSPTGLNISMLQHEARRP